MMDPSNAARNLFIIYYSKAIIGSRSRFMRTVKSHDSEIKHGLPGWLQDQRSNDIHLAILIVASECWPKTQNFILLTIIYYILCHIGILI